MRTKLTILATILLASFVFVGCTSLSEHVEEPNEAQEQIYGPTTNDSTEAAHDEPESLAYKIDALLTQNNFSGAIFVRQGEDVILSQTYGMADRANNVPLTIHTPLSIASITKQFTGAAILQLEEQGKLDTSATLDYFFPGYDGLENVTVAELVSMRGGFGLNNWVRLNEHIEEIVLGPPEASVAFVEEFMSSISEEDLALFLAGLQASNGDIFRTLMELQTLESVRAFILNYVKTFYLTNWGGETLVRYNYSNPDYWLLGLIIEQASGMTFEEYIMTNFFEPLGMRNSGFLAISEASHRYNIHGEVFLYGLTFTRAFASGGLVSTIYDLSLWMDAYFSGELFDIARLDEIDNNIYNYGWTFRHNIWRHGGSVGGVLIAYTIHDRESDTTIIILSNELSTRLRLAVPQIAELLLDVILLM